MHPYGTMLPVIGTFEGSDPLWIYLGNNDIAVDVVFSMSKHMCTTSINFYSNSTSAHRIGCCGSVVKLIVTVNVWAILVFLGCTNIRVELLKQWIASFMYCGKGDGGIRYYCTRYRTTASHKKHLLHNVVTVVHKLHVVVDTLFHNIWNRIPVPHHVGILGNFAMRNLRTFRCLNEKNILPSPICNVSDPIVKHPHVIHFVTANWTCNSHFAHDRGQIRVVIAVTIFDWAIRMVLLMPFLTWKRTSYPASRGICTANCFKFIIVPAKNCTDLTHVVASRERCSSFEFNIILTQHCYEWFH